MTTQLMQWCCFLAEPVITITVTNKQFVLCFHKLVFSKNPLGTCKEIFIQVSAHKILCNIFYFFFLGPKLLQAVLSAIGDVCMIEMFAKFMTNSKEKLWIFGVLYTSNWFLLYASSRTLINTMETCLTNIALKLFVTKDPRYCFLMTRYTV